jgi:hypothetical protein
MTSFPPRKCQDSILNYTTITTKIPSRKLSNSLLTHNTTLGYGKNHLMLFGVINILYCKNHPEHIPTPCGGKKRRSFFLCFTTWYIYLPLCFKGLNT